MIDLEDKLRIMDKQIKLIKELSECITLLSDEEGEYTAEYIIERYLQPIVMSSDNWKVI